MAKSISKKNEKLLETLSLKFLKKYGCTIKIRKRLSRYDNYVAYKWDGLIWVETNIADVKLILSQCCDEMGLKGETKKTLIESFFDKNSLDYRNFNVDGKRYFVCLSGVINLEALRNKNFSSVSEMLLHKAEWLVPHSHLKNNYFTTISLMTIPETIEEEVFQYRLALFMNRLKTSMCGRIDYAEALIDYFSSFLYGKTKSPKFVHMFGVGGVGKTLFLEILEYIFGKSYFYKMPIDVFNKKDVKTHIAMFYAQFVRVINVSEIENILQNTDQIKTITGSETVPFGNLSFRLNAHLVFDNNHLNFDDSSAYRRREVILPFGFADKDTPVNPSIRKKLFDVTPEVFLEMLRRFSTLDVENMPIPRATEDVITNYRLLTNDTETFCEVFVTTDPHGKNYSSSSLYHNWFIKDFDIWRKNLKKSLPWAQDIKLRNLAEIKIKELENSLANRFHKNFVQGKQLTFQKIIVGNPGDWGTMRNRHKVDLMKLYVKTEAEVEAMIQKEEGVAAVKILENQYENDYRDVLGEVTPEQWKKNILNLLCNSLFSNNQMSLMQFKTILSDSIQSTEQSIELCALLKEKIIKNNCIFKHCWFDCDIVDALDKLLEYFARWRRGDNKRRKCVSPTDPTIRLSGMLPSIPEKTVQNFLPYVPRQIGFDPFMMQQPIFPMFPNNN